MRDAFAFLRQKDIFTEPLAALRGKVTVSMPLGKSGPDPITFENFVNLCLHTERVIGDLAFIVAAGKPTVSNRQEIARRFMETGREWLFWVDSDMVFQADWLCRMLETCLAHPEIKVLSGTARMSGGSPRPVLYTRSNGQYHTINKWGKELFTVDAVGTFGMLMHRSVFEQIKQPWFSYEVPGYGSDDAINFCKRLNAANIKIWIDPSLPFGHIDKSIIDGLSD